MIWSNILLGWTAILIFEFEYFWILQSIPPMPVTYHRICHLKKSIVKLDRLGSIGIGTYNLSKPIERRNHRKDEWASEKRLAFVSTSLRLVLPLNVPQRPAKRYEQGSNHYQTCYYYINGTSSKRNFEQYSVPQNAPPQTMTNICYGVTSIW